MIDKKSLLIVGMLLYTLSYADSIKDQDFDGVPDYIDQCPHTPFLNEVNAQGCTTKILTLPYETGKESITLTIGYGLSTNEDLIERSTQTTSTVQLGYYRNNWSYSLRTGYYIHNKNSGLLDTTFKIKKRIELTPSLKVGLGAGIKLPTYQFKGNQTDYILYSSLSYYPTSQFSLFTGMNHTFVRDEKITIPLQDTNSFYIGTGYFFSDHFYINLSYGYLQSKFSTEHAAKSISSTLYYKINKKWFSTLSYSQDIDDEDLHNRLNFKIGYTIW